MESIEKEQRENRLSKSREKLTALEKEGKFVFHGSSREGIEELEPRQAYNYKATEEPKKDSMPAIAASPYVDVAIFRALVKKGKNAFASDGHGNLKFEADREALDDAKERIGYIYVLPKDNFYSKSGHDLAMDWRSEKPVKPVDVIKVTYEDLPVNIDIVENDL